MPRSIRYDDSHLRKLLGLGESRPSAYGGAGLVGYAQIEQNAHYASGVVTGALLGWSVAHAVVHRCNRPLDSNKLSVSAPSLVFQVVLMGAIRGTTAGRLVNGETARAHLGLQRGRCDGRQMYYCHEKVTIPGVNFLR
jgi:hypothetical protein